MRNKRQDKSWHLIFLSLVFSIVILASCGGGGGGSGGGGGENSNTPPDTTSPTILSNTPSGEAKNVAINITAVSVSFSEAMNAATINTSTFTVSDGTNNISGTVTYSGTTATFTFSFPLAYSTLYTATVTTGAKDLAGNAMANNYFWTFTTETDTTPPMVISTNPLNTANGASLTAPITATFSEALDPNTITTASFIILSGAGSQVNGAVALSSNGKTITFTPSNPLSFNTDYTATITTAVKDTVGNNLNMNYTWRFNTGAKIVADGAHTCARLANGAVKCWGRNEFGRLGLGDTNNRGDAANEMGDNLPAVELGAGRTAVELAAGGLHTCARLDNGAVKCWGYNFYGQLGLGDTNNRGDAANEMGDNLPAVELGAGRTAVELAAGGLYTCARLDNGAVKCWGLNEFGQLGLGDTNNRGDAINEMGDNLPAVELGAGRTAVKLAANYTYTCALLDNGAVKCWGRNEFGQLGLGDTNNRGDEANEMGDNLPAVELGAGLTTVELAAGGLYHTCALLDNGAVKCWGYNNYGQLGLGDTNNRGDAINEMGDNLPAVELGAGRTAVEITTGASHTCARLDNGSVKCWGYNGEGQLGFSEIDRRGDAANEMGDNLPAVELGAGRTVVELSAGGSHTCVQLDNGAVKCWGYNLYGQLGIGDTANRGRLTSDMGDNLPAVELGTPQ